MCRRLFSVFILLFVGLSFGCAPKLKGPVFSIDGGNSSGAYGYVSEVKGESIFLEGERVYGVSVSADGHYLLLNRFNGDVIIDPETHWTYEVADGAVFSPDSESVAIPDDDGVKIINIRTHDLMHAWGCSGEPDCIILSPDGKFMAVATDESVRVLNVNDGKIVFEEELEDAYLAFSADSRKLLIRLRNNISGEAGPVAPGPITGMIVASLWLADATVGVCEDDKLFLYDFENEQMLMEQVAVDGVIKAAKLSPDGRLLAVAKVNDWESSTKSVLEIYDTINGKKIYSWDTPQTLRGIVFSPDSERITVYSSMHAGGLVTYNLETGKQSRKLSHKGVIYISDVDYSPDGRFLAIAGSGFRKEQSVLALYDTAQERVLYARIIDTAANDVAFLPDGKAFIAVTDKGARLIPITEFSEMKAASVQR